MITSTDDQNLAWASPDGAYYSDHFLTSLDDQNLYNSFYNAQIATQIVHPSQVAWLDSNGNGIPNEGVDIAISAQRSLPRHQTLSDSWPPYIVQAQIADSIEGGQGLLQAEVLDDGLVSHVWATIYPPSYRPPESGSELGTDTVPVIGLSLQGDIYSATYSGFDEIGTYRIVFHAEDNDGINARPVAIEVRNVPQNVNPNSAMYLPLFVKR